MPKRPLVVDVSEENKQLGIQPMNVGGLLVTTGPELAPIAPLGGTYWVDNTYTGGSNDGSDERPFTTIAAGLARIAAQVGFASGTLLIAGNPNYTGEGVIACPDSITARIFAWGSPSQQPVSFSMTCGTGAPLLYLRGCNVTLTLGQAIVQADMTSIVAVSNVGGSTLVMRGGSARLSSQVCRLTGEWDDAACSNMAIGSVEAALDCVSLKMDACTLEAVTLVAGELEFRTTATLSAVAITCGTIRMDRQSERSAALAGARPSSLPIPFEATDPIYGCGGTGNVTQAASAVLALTNEYDNLTMGAGGQLRFERGIMRVRNLLSLTAAGINALVDYLGGGGGNAAGTAAGAVWGGTGGSSQGNAGTLNVPGGAVGGTGAGAAAAAVGTINATFGGTGGGSPAGGAGKGNAGGAASPAPTVTNPQESVHWPLLFSGPSSVVTAGMATTAPVPVMGSAGGRSGASGGGDGAASGGGGGGGGRGGGAVVIYARGIAVGAATPANVIRADGQDGGTGGNASGGEGGGGAGGGGGGGGVVVLLYDWIIGTGAAANGLNAGGGNGGKGGNGAGAAGVGANGSNGGQGGQIVLVNRLTGVRLVTLGAAGAAGAAAVGNAGGAGGAGGACLTSFP